MALSRIGFDRSAIAALFQQGLSSHKDLLSKDYEQINAVEAQIGKMRDSTAVLPATSVELLIALRYYLQHMAMRGEHRELDVLLVKFCENQNVRLKYTGHYAEHKSRQKGPAVPAYAPRSVSVTASGWPQFDDGFRNMLRGKLNSELGAPLSYVIRTPEFEEFTTEDRLADYPSLLSDMERTIELKGAMFEAENRHGFPFF